MSVLILTLLDLQFKYAKMATMEDEDDDDNVCCRDRLVKCWQHYVTNVFVEHFRVYDEKRLVAFFTKQAMRLECISVTPYWRRRKMNLDHGEWRWLMNLVLSNIEHLKKNVAIENACETKQTFELFLLLGMFECYILWLSKFAAFHCFISFFS